jgi:type IV pilus assembly protein PilV
MRAKLHPHRGSILLESLLAIVIFSVGLLSLLMLLSTALVEVGNARYRSEASLLAADLIAEMWTGDRSVASLQARYAVTTSEAYQRWQQRVAAQLPGVTELINSPTVSVDADRSVSITLSWQGPGQAHAHSLLATARITD